jgi:hypothetical protein
VERKYAHLFSPLILVEELGATLLNGPMTMYKMEEEHYKYFFVL